MRLSVDRKELARVLMIAKAFAPTRSPKPVLLSVKLTAGSDGASLSATDLETGGRFALKYVDVLEHGSALLPVSRLASLLKDSTDATLHIESDGKSVTIRGERNKLELSADDASQFPLAVDDGSDSVDHVTIPAAVLSELIKRTLYAVDTESSRYALGGVLLELNGDMLHALATDGRRMAHVAYRVELTGAPVLKTPKDKDTNTEHVIVPEAALKRLAKALPKSGPVHFAIRGNCIVFAADNVTVSTRLLDGRFPQWRMVFPQSAYYGAAAELDCAEVLGAIKNVAFATSAEARGVDFSMIRDMLLLSAKSVDNGEAKATCAASFNSEPVAISLDPRFCAEFLKSLDPSAIVTLRVQDSDSVAIWIGPRGNGELYEYATMPLARDR
jgi:DNA polymerase-3 subunit beta